MINFKITGKMLKILTSRMTSWNMDLHCLFINRQQWMPFLFTGCLQILHDRKWLCSRFGLSHQCIYHFREWCSLQLTKYKCSRSRKLQGLGLEQSFLSSWSMQLSNTFNNLIVLSILTWFSTIITYCDFLISSMLYWSRYFFSW